MRGIVGPIVAVVISVFASCTQEGCYPPGGAELETEYRAKLMDCVAHAPTLRASCECRLEVDRSYGLCDDPAWPRIGRCDYKCEGQ